MSASTNAFFDGMSRLNLFPKVKPVEEASVYSAWQDVADAFYRTGNAIRTVMNETRPAHDPGDGEYQSSEGA
jgi:hypothetical protein